MIETRRYSMHSELLEGTVVLYFSIGWPAKFAGAAVWGVKGNMHSLPRNWIVV